MTAGPDHINRHREIRVELSLERAVHLFTPVGERLWAEGWDPEFPAGEDGDGTTPGTVFLTASDWGTTYWVVTERDDDYLRYARITPGVWAGMVEVRAREGEEGATIADVGYVLTALSDEGRTELRTFDDGYNDYIDSWERDIANAMQAGRIS
ncbi:MAG: SRPBCC family protein [Thermoleophilaceae bacterium]